jgi:hypothetical protein
VSVFGASNSVSDVAFSVARELLSKASGERRGNGKTSEVADPVRQRAGSETAQFSPEGRRLAAEAASASNSATRSAKGDVGETKSDSVRRENTKVAIEKMKARDREVRSHEQAHKAVGGNLAGAIHLTLARGPDGQDYAVGGSVPIDVSPVPDDPGATISKMRRVAAAAMAPADPSGADQQIAAAATSNAAEALRDLATKRFEQMDGNSKQRAQPTLQISA